MIVQCVRVVVQCVRVSGAKQVQSNVLGSDTDVYMCVCVVRKASDVNFIAYNLHA
jgi:hypothetical protein